VPAREDPWLAGVLGRPVYAVDGDPGDEPGFHYAKVDVEDVARVRARAGRGFYVVDVNVTLAHERSGAGDVGNAEVARPEHHQALLEIAGSCFRYSRFHLDPQLPDELADAVKREWVRSYVEGTRGLELLAAVEDGAPAGFLAVLERDGARVIDLIGVAPSAQGKGVGSALVQGFVARHLAAGRELLVGTQAANVPSLRLYAALGFSVRSSAYVLHRHVEGW
jgi:GNAT superfamily N-acetyltransferase